MRIISHRKHATNITQAERMISAIGGGILASLGLQKRSPAGLGLTALGAGLLFRGITGHSIVYEALGIRTAPLGQGAGTTSVPYELGIRVDQSITINKPRAEVFGFWRDLTNLPRFMKHVVSITETGPDYSHWVVQAPAGRTVEWDAVIHNQMPDQLIAWRSLPGADVGHAGSVWFKDAPAGRGTEVRVELQYNPPAGVVGAALSTLWGREPSMQVEEDLRRLKQYLEAGEIPTTKGQPSGRMARSTEAKRQDHGVNVASEASFPASDAPAYNR